MKKTIMERARSQGVDLVGIARVRDVELAYPPRPAEDLLSGARSVIVFAGALLWGTLNCPRGTKGAIKDAQIAYERCQMAESAVGRFLESEGHACYFVPASMPVDAYRHKGTTYFAAEWSHRQAAIAACMGVKGMNNLLVTPEFGPYVRISSMLTTAEIPPTKRKLPQLCNHCMKCVEACPVGALSREPGAGQCLDQPRCKNHYIRPFLDSSPLKTLRGILTTECWAVSGVQALMEGYHFSCAECQRVCPAGSLALRRKRAKKGGVKPLHAAAS